ncbi:MAG: hypothetical protein RI947_286 [Candidatus Parcubacteria bacterium]|jgi:hypothetical protein
MNTTIEEIINRLIHIGDMNLTSLFFKAFAVLLSILYLLYTIIAHRQTKLMIRTLHTNNHGVILLISTIQIFVALAVVALAFLFV